MTIQGFREMYVAELQEACSFETMIAGNLENLAEKASDERLQRILREHAGESEDHRRTVEGILQTLGEAADSHKDRSVEALVQETERMAGMVAEGPLRDAAMIASVQRAEHYEMAVYGTLAAYAQAMGREADRQLLLEILEEEKDTDELLSDVAVGIVNPSAVETEARAGASPPPP